MRKLLFIAALLVASATQAQEFKIGPKAGIGTAGFNFNGTYEGYLTFLIGAQTDISLSERLSLSPEAYYIRNGYDSENAPYYFDYINVPVLLRYFVASGFNIHAGPEVGFLIQDDISDVYYIFGEDIETESVNFSAAVGVGYQFDSGLNLDLRYTTGLQEVSAELGNKTYQLSISVGYLF